MTVHVDGGLFVSCDDFNVQCFYCTISGFTNVMLQRQRKHRQMSRRLLLNLKSLISDNKLASNVNKSKI